jgi:hypothetical protein
MQQLHCGCCMIIHNVLLPAWKLAGWLGWVICAYQPLALGALHEVASLVFMQCGDISAAGGPY